jgi:hypothetical protein
MADWFGAPGALHAVDRCPVLGFLFPVDQFERRE